MTLKPFDPYSRRGAGTSSRWRHRWWAICVLVVGLPGIARGLDAEVDRLLSEGESLFAKGDYAGAEAAARRSAELADRRLADDDVGRVYVALLLGRVLEARGDYAGARTRYEAALQTLETLPAYGPHHPGVAAPLVNLANVLLLEGDYARAEQAARRAVGVNERHPDVGPDHPQTALATHCLALVLAMKGDFAGSEEFAKRTVATKERVYGPDSAEVGVSLEHLAGVCFDRGDHLQAEPIYRRIVTIAERTKGPDHPDTAIAFNNLARLYRAMGDYDRAEPLQRRVLGILERAFPAEHPRVAHAASNVGELLLNTGRTREARVLFERSAAVRQKILGPGHPLTCVSWQNLAFAAAGLGDWPAALDAAERGRRGVRRHVARVLPALTDREQVQFLKVRDEANFHGSLSIGLARSHDARAAEQSAGWLANGKAVGQEASAERVRIARQADDPAARQAVADLAAVRRELAMLRQAVAGGTAEAARARIADLERREQELVLALGVAVPWRDGADPWVGIDAIRAAIPPGTVFIDVARLRPRDFTVVAAQGRRFEPFGAARYVAWIVPPAGKGDVTILDLGPAAEIEKAVADYREAIDAVQKGGFQRGQDAAEQELRITAAPLTQKLLEPIVERIGSVTTIVISPDGALWLVPWQALPLADGSYAIEKFTIRTATSGRDLVPVPVEATDGRGGPVVVADPAFDSAPAASGGKPAADASRALGPATDVVRRFGRLPNTRTEALASKAVLATLTGSEPKVLLGPDASEANLRRSAVRARTVVLATHGFFKPDQEARRDDKSAALATGGPDGRGAAPAVTTTGAALEDPLLRCGLALAGANVGATTAGDDDGILTGAEIVGLDLLGTDLVVLSACETGVGTVQNGEGVAGLRQAFQIAGARSVVATLWQVPDAESAQIMAAFYTNLAQGQPPARALREAQLAFIKARREDRNYEAAHPYLWAAYGVTGG
ncbi:MAG: CHAT domain-containing protein [Planctomycetaceae bacterium]